MFVAIRNLANFLLFMAIDFFIVRGKTKINPGTLLIIRYDSIGDYILFRKFIRALKEDEKYKDHKITLCGNIAWRELAVSLDSDVVDEFIWMDRKQFLKSTGYKISFLKMIRSKGFETVINSTYTREILFGDQVVKSSGAPVRIGSAGSPEKNARTRIFSDRFYTRLVPAAGDNLFEFYRNMEFFENLLGRKPGIKNSQIAPSKLKKFGGLPEKYCVIFPGANNPKRRWSTGNFAEICEYLKREYNLPAVIPLSGKEKFLADDISQRVNSEMIIDLSGKASLTELADIIAGAELLISNDTSAVHFAAAVNKKFLCITSGLYFGRFLPYPVELCPFGKYLYPPRLERKISLEGMDNEEFRYSSGLDINSIPVQRVKEEIKVLLG